jgi:hypothetical protein
LVPYFQQRDEETQIAYYSSFSLQEERKILVCFKALLIKQYSMQKNLKYSTAMVKDIWMHFLDVSVEGSFKVLYKRAQDGVLGGSYVWMILSLCTQMSNP